ncbi:MULTISPECIES: hypothetical protein [Paenibacillus]|uniref:hypothetical protein n=1 Tax=Paenibacillus TaxID=44249 RepID=UPI0022B8B1C9|nr:hypothetical protein [Paenibacillus caseinilyticus]MCZ8521151.1 hypothetical protein [Paenibacillus caseinilyticus]
MHPKTRNRRNRSTLLPVLLLLAAALGGCSAEADSRLAVIKDEVAGIKDEVAGAVSGLRETIGASVASLDAVNSQVVQGASKLILLLEELDFDLSYRENGIAFTSGQGVSGLVGVSGNMLVLDVSSVSSDAAAAQTIIRIANVFSDANAVEDKIGAFIGRDQVQETPLPGGYIRSDGQKLDLHLETPLLQ